MIQSAFFVCAPPHKSGSIVKLRFLVPLFAAAALVGCLGNSGDSISPPSDVQPVVGDGIAGITWTPGFGVVYLAFGSTNPSLTTQNWTDPGIAGFAVLNAGTKSTPPALVCGVANGLSYYFTVDAHTGSAPGGAGSRTVGATPRSAGGQTASDRGSAARGWPGQAGHPGTRAAGGIASVG